MSRAAVCVCVCSRRLHAQSEQQGSVFTESVDVVDVSWMKVTGQCWKSAIERSTDIHDLLESPLNITHTHCVCVCVCV